MADLAFVLDSGFGCGGSERVAAHLISELIAQGHTIHVITMRGPEHDFFLMPHGAKRIVLDGVARSKNRLVGLWRNFARVLRLRRALQDSHASIIVAFQTRTNIRTLAASVGLGKRVVISERNDPSRQRFGWPWRWLRFLLYRYADAVTANSYNALKAMQGYVRKERLIFVPNPVVIPSACAAPDRSTIILNVSSLKPQKCQAVLVEALRLVGNQATQWTVELLGEGPERSRLEAMRDEYRLTERIHLRGRVSNTSSFYLAAGLFVLPSLFEGTPNALLEAMAHGLPSIVSDSLPGALEYAEHGVNALVFRAGDPIDLADKLVVLMEDPVMRARLGSAARQKMTSVASDEATSAWYEAFRLIPSSG